MDNQKRKPIRSKAIRQAARGENCTVRFPGCENRRDTVVFCHSNYNEDGKGMGRKADDIYGVFACHHCHDVLDKRKTIQLVTNEVIRDFFHAGLKRTWRRLIERGIITINEGETHDRDDSPI